MKHYVRSIYLIFELKKYVLIIYFNNNNNYYAPNNLIALIAYIILLKYIIKPYKMNILNNYRYNYNFNLLQK